MTVVLWLLAVQGLLGAFDTLYFHEWQARLPARGGGIRVELALHAVRDFVYAVIFATLPWFEWRGVWSLALITLLAIEIVVTFTDFVVEDRVRHPLGGVHPGERVMHGAMAIVYGAMLASLVPVLGRWLHDPTGIVALSHAPLGLRLSLTVAGGTILVSGVRDLLAACAVPHSEWPWARPTRACRRERVVAAPCALHWQAHQRTFWAAGVYNIAWGVFSIVYPQWLFDVAGMPRANHAQIFATLGLVIGLYGVLYLDVARHPENGWLIAAVGFAGKVLGPIGLAYLLVTGRWPLRSMVICLTNDVIWWIPFARYLRDSYRLRRGEVATVWGHFGRFA
jgi:hypothetical protein